MYFIAQGKRVYATADAVSFSIIGANLRFYCKAYQQQAA